MMTAQQDDDDDHIHNHHHEVSSSCSSCISRRLISLLIIGIATTCALALVRIVESSNNHSSSMVTTEEREILAFDVDGPPVALEEGETIIIKEEQQEKLTQLKRLTSSTTTDGTSAIVIDNDDEDNSEQLLIIEEDDKQIPTGTIAGIVKASDALICRESVINFVINATDNKDECEGLKKAFDRTCTNDPDQGTGEQSRRRRRLIESQRKLNAWKAHVYRASITIDKYLRWLLVVPESPFVFMEDEVAGFSWDLAKYQVENDIDMIVLAHLRRRLEETRANDTNASEAFEYAAELMQDDDDEEEEEVVNVTITKPPEGKPKISLALPTSTEHLSPKVLTESLMLQQEGTVINSAIKASQNQTKNTTHEEAVKDAAASTKAVSDTSAAVSAVLNDPSAIEARTCCASILNVYHENCDTDYEEHYSDSRLFVIVVVMALCGIVKTLIRHYHVHWLPEAAGCILVGVLMAGMMSFFPHHDLSFDGNWFLRIMVPPIIFEAALSIDKRSFNRHIVPIFMYAVIGTLLATFLTAFVVHFGSKLLPGCSTINFIESLTFGALISSIDPIAVLSVLSNMGMTDTDTIYVVIFGESLLNDGIAIVLFETLVHFLDDNIVVDGEAVAAATAHFVVVAVGSVMVGVASGVVCNVYYWAMYECQTPLVEVIMFLCWALLPYYICDGIGWSGIVSVVATGFVMDINVVGQQGFELLSEDSEEVNGGDVRKQPLRRPIFAREGHLSEAARTHVHFVTEILATLMETAIFAYLGLFLFSSRYHWNVWHTVVAILACCISRGIMIPSLSTIANWITAIRQNRVRCGMNNNRRGTNNHQNNPAGVIIDKRMQLVLWFAGLRGAMSFALVEHIPLYDDVSGEGSRFKAELKAMTSASILFTVFVLGGYTYYLMDSMGMTPAGGKSSSSSSSHHGGHEIAALLEQQRSKDTPRQQQTTPQRRTTANGTESKFTDYTRNENEPFSVEKSNEGGAVRRQRRSPNTPAR